MISCGELRDMGFNEVLMGWSWEGIKSARHYWLRGCELKYKCKRVIGFLLGLPDPQNMEFKKIIFREKKTNSINIICTILIYFNC